MTKTRKYECFDLIANAESIIPEFYKSGKIDTVKMIMDYIDGTCGGDNFVILRILNDVGNPDFDSDWCQSDFIDIMIESGFMRRGHFPIERPYYPYWIVAEIYLNDDFSSFIINIAEEKYLITKPQSLERAMCTYIYWGADSLYKEMSQDLYKGKCVQEKYDRLIADTKRRLKISRGLIEITSGIWTPLGANKAIGSKYEIGGSLGRRPGKIGLNLYGALRIADPDKPFLVKYGDQIRPTDRFILGYCVSGNLSYDIIRHGRFEIDCFVGMGLDGFNVIRKSDTTSGMNLDSFAAHFGLTQRIFYNKHRIGYLGLQLRFSLLNFKSNGGTDISGNAVTINLIWGSMGNKYAIRDAETLHYFDKKKKY